MAFDSIFQGAPSAVAAGNTPQYAALGVDTVNNVLYISAGAGWVPVGGGSVSAATAAAQVANNANVLTFTVPQSGLYSITGYEVSTNTPTAATLPSITAVYTDVATAGSVTATVVASKASVSAAGSTNSGTITVNAVGGTTIVIATASYAAGSGTALAYTVKANISFIA